MSNTSAPAVAFCVQVIKVLADSPNPIGISEISRRADINKNMVSRILHTLEEENWVQCDERSGYTLTLYPFCLAAQVVNRASLVSVGTPLLEKFWELCGESTYLGVLHNDEVLYLSHFDSRQKVRVAGVVGGSYPLYCTAPGKVLLAFSGEEYQNAYLEKTEFKAHTQTTITEKNALLEELKAIRARGYSIDNQEFGNGIICISAPVFDYTGKAVGVIGCSLSTVYCSVEELYEKCGTALMQTAIKISKCLGYLE